MDSLSFDVLVFVVWPLGDSKIYFGMFHKDVSYSTSFMASFMTSCNVSALSCESSNLLCFTIAKCQQYFCHNTVVLRVKTWRECWIFFNLFLLIFKFYIVSTAYLWRTEGVDQQELSETLWKHEDHSLLAMKFDGLSIPHTCDHNSFICSFVFAERPVMYTKRSPWGQSMLLHQVRGSFAVSQLLSPTFCFSLHDHWIFSFHCQLMLQAGGVSSPGLQDFSSELRLAIQGTSVSSMPNY